ncbi:NADH-quinone oxidoreductase subunit NuoN [Kineosporia succinea]|uniref:NADH-quinone oxidoreductase subunit N n=1 Tax=Kineosporia succinea TaxID=84632 RepID=A0ABT9P362_9ACTN|nr:NADH-quinone oxidoreductase subunit NuoN [Kineosporia succinea]MDP9827121.1 NADH-quinone oxidoreductase subunit N [Kineosporia succinea]
MKAPSVDYVAVAPMLIVFVAALVAVLVEAFVPRAQRFIVQVFLATVAIAASLIFVVYLGTQSTSLNTAGGAVVIDGPALFLQGTILVLGLMAVLTMADEATPESSAFTAQASAVPGSADEARASRLGLVQTEIYPLILFSMVGMLLFPASNDLLTMFIALEVLSLPLYLLCGMARRRRLLSQEASLKYFLLGAFSSAFFLFGSALLYGFSGSVRLSDIANAVADGGGTTAASAVVGKDGLLLMGIGLLAVGLLFKVGAVPFQSWTPDVYQGAPTPVTGFMAACTKVAAFGALLRIAYVAVPGARWDWQPAIWVVAALTMLVGAIVAIVQADVKRMLAYSSIAHAGFILVGLMAMDRDGVGSVLFYLASYGFTTVGAFALVTLVRTSTPEGGVGGEATHLSQWQGLGKRSPLLAAIFTLFLLAFAGIPLTSGFTGKFAVFSAAADGAPWGVGLVLIGVAASAIAVFFYIRVIVLMYFNDSVGDAVTVTRPGALTILAVGVGVVATVGLGILPSAALGLANSSSVFLP